MRILLSLKRTITRLRANCQGQTMLEYALLAGFVAVAIALVLAAPGDNIKAIYQDTAAVLDSTESGSAPAASPAAPSADPTGDSGGGGKNKKPKKPKKNK